MMMAIIASHFLTDKSCIIRSAGGFRSHDYIYRKRRICTEPAQPIIPSTQEGVS